jgi:hypothetical protein
MFKIGQTNVTDAERLGCTSTELKKWKKVEPRIADRRVTIMQTAQKLNAS